MEVSPEQMIDCDLHRQVFASMLQFKDEARVLALQDKEGTGKTTLLNRLRYDCQFEFEKQVPVSHVHLEMSRENNAFDFVVQLRSDFRLTSAGLYPPLAFPTFDRLNLALAKRDFQPFEPPSTSGAVAPPAAATGGPLVRGIVDARNAEVQGGTVGGIVIGKFDVGRQGAEWRPEMEAIAQRDCTTAFFQDLRTICETQPLILLLDSWDRDRGNADLRQWLLMTVLRPLCFDKQRPKYFVVVIAGRDLPDFKGLLGAKYASLVKSDPLEAFGEERVRAFLKLHDFSNIKDDDFAFVCSKLKSRQWSFQKTLQMLKGFQG